MVTDWISFYLKISFIAKWFFLSKSVKRMKEKIKRNALGHYYFRCIKCLSQIHHDNFSSFHYIDFRASKKIKRNSFYNKICINKWPIHRHVFNSHLKSRTSTWIFYLYLINKKYSDKNYSKNLHQQTPKQN